MYEYIYYCIYYRSIYKDYFLFGLYQKKYTEHITKFIPISVIEKCQIKLNKSETSKLIGNKALFADIMRRYKIPVVKELFRVSKSGIIIDSVGDNISKEMAISIINKYFYPVFIKMNAGFAGKGAYIFDQKTGAIEDLFSNIKDEIIVQPVIKQHEILCQLHKASLNTIRIDTLIINNECKHSFAVLRVGRDNSVVDNSDKGAIVIKIDIITGKLYPIGRTKTKFGTKDYYEHPNTGIKFAGIIIPYWDTILEMVKKTAFIFPEAKSVGWDVAITRDGPLIVEGNPGWGSSMPQLHGGLADTPIGQCALEMHRGAL